MWTEFYAKKQVNFEYLQNLPHKAMRVTPVVDKILCTKSGHCRFLVPQKCLTKIWHHFRLKMMVKSGLEKNILKFNSGLQRFLLTWQAKFSLSGQIFFLQWAAATLNFKIFFSRPLFTIMFRRKNFNFRYRFQIEGKKRSINQPSKTC